MWPDKVIRQFNTVPANFTPSISDPYHGPYNKLLYTLFPPETDFVVVPLFLVPETRSPTDPIVTFGVFLVNEPVFILHLKPPSQLNVPSKRYAADEQIRSRMVDLVERYAHVRNCPPPTLHAVSAFGTKLRFYHLDTNENDQMFITPPAIPHDPVKWNITAPAHRWDCDILTADGEERFRAVVKEVINGCTGEGKSSG